ncbi:MAG TPA: endonuclease [Pantanalinema sp.]
MKPFVIALASVLLASSLAACGTSQHLQPAPYGTSRTKAFDQAPADYYRAAEGQQGQSLLRSLAGIVSKHKELGYDRARDVMFADVDDLDGDDVVECDYTDRQLDKITDRNSAYRNGKGFNAEHTWPQSKGAVGVAKSDLHHLFPTDCNANSMRSSFPFGEVVTVTWSEGGSKLGLDASGETVFEPRDEQKGNTARALFYFYTVYGQQADLSNFRHEEATLKKWHAKDPVTALDRARNDAVYRLQGNRNPFVDVPEFVQGVGSFLPTLNTPAFKLR